MDDLIGADNVGRSDTSSSSTDIESLGELYEFSSRDVGATNENGHL